MGEAEAGQVAFQQFQNIPHIDFHTIWQYSKISIVFFAISSVLIIGLTIGVIVLGFEDAQMWKYGDVNVYNTLFSYWGLILAVTAIIFLVALTLLYRYIFLPQHIQKLQIAAQTRLNDKRLSAGYKVQRLIDQQIQASGAETKDRI